MTISRSEYTDLMNAAQEAVRAQDEGQDIHLPLSERLLTVQAAIEHGILADDLFALARAQAMIEDAVVRLQKNVARVAAQEVAWKYRERRPVKRRRS